MTLRLLKSRRIIRWNTPLSNNAQPTAGRGPWLQSGLAALLLAAGTVPAMADEPPDPISRLGQRSAEDRWKEARREWLPLPFSRRARRQERQAAAAAEAKAGMETPGVIEAPATAPINPGSLTRTKKGSQETMVTPGIEPATEAPRPFKIATDSEPSKRGILRPRFFGSISAALSPDDQPVPSEPSDLAPAAEPTRHEAPRAGAARGIGSARSLMAARPDGPILSVAQLEKPTPPPVTDAATAEQQSTPFETVVPPRQGEAPQDKPLPDESELNLPNDPLTNAPLRLRKISEIQPYRGYAPDGTPTRLCPPEEELAENEPAPRCPEDQELPLFGSVDRNFIDIHYCWEASNVFHNPLYFSDVALERYGHTYSPPVQAVASAGKFGLQLVGLPYQLALDNIHNREYPLGYYRPGECAPKRCYQIPLNAKAAAVAAGAYTGVAFLFP